MLTLKKPANLLGVINETEELGKLGLEAEMEDKVQRSILESILNKLHSLMSEYQDAVKQHYERKNPKSFDADPNAELATKYDYLF
jgi:hypothetical protein